jgi:hypothetical protein
MTTWLIMCMSLKLAALVPYSDAFVANRFPPRKFSNFRLSFANWNIPEIGTKSSGLLPAGSDDGFGFEDILSEEDVKEYRGRFSKLAEMFPEVSWRRLREIVEMSPLLLTIETDALRRGVVVMRQELPFVDPSYVITQRSAGLDLLISLMSPSFNLRSRWEDVVDVIGMKRNATDFIRRVPQSLTPRYILALRDHCMAMRELLGLDRDAAVDIVCDWPTVLTINLSMSISRVQSSLRKHGILPLRPARANNVVNSTAGRQEGASTDDDSSISRSERDISSEERVLLAKIVRQAPRCLAEDVSRRVQQLSRTFPGWNMRTVITGNPRVLIQKMDILKAKYQV